MAKKKSTPEVAGPSMDRDWQTRDDANRIMDYEEICSDKDRFKRASTRIKNAARTVSKPRGRSQSR